MGLSIYQRIQRAANDQEGLFLPLEDILFITSEPWFKDELEISLKRARRLVKLANPPVPARRRSKGSPKKKALSKKRSTKKKTSRRKQ
jgi:hypothetical protein